MWIDINYNLTSLTSPRHENINIEMIERRDECCQKSNKCAVTIKLINNDAND